MGYLVEPIGGDDRANGHRVEQDAVVGMAIFEASKISANNVMVWLRHLRSPLI
jgi:hypothetical protein